MIFSEEGMSPDPKKTAIIRNWPAPLTVRDVKSFLQTRGVTQFWTHPQIPNPQRLFFCRYL
jgi:hypothetical protein